MTKTTVILKVPRIAYVASLRNRSICFPFQIKSNPKVYIYQVRDSFPSFGSSEAIREAPKRAFDNETRSKRYVKI
jgi:hypothetical protein